MPTVTDSISIAANATNDNVVSGKRVNDVPPTAPNGAMISLYETGSATGLRSELWIGERNPKEDGLVNVQNRVPVVPDDIVVANEGGIPNERIRLRVQNTTGGALTYFYRLDCEII